LPPGIGTENITRDNPLATRHLQQKDANSAAKVATVTKKCVYLHFALRGKADTAACQSGRKPNFKQ
jgi:hypothetical protein